MTSKLSAPTFQKHAEPFLIHASAELNHPYSGTGVQLPDGEILIAFEKWVKDRKPPFESHIWLVSLKDGKIIREARRLDKNNAKFSYHPQFVVNGKATYLYFNVFDPKSDTASFVRAELVDGVFDTKTTLKVKERLVGQYRPWIYPFISKSGLVILTYEWRDPILERQRLKLALSRDGINFGESLDFGVGVMGRASEFADGGYIYTFQNGDPERTMDFFKLSQNVRQWAFDRPISEQVDVHDAIPFQRLDGGIDIYYLSSSGGSTNSIFRRSINSFGELGPEQELTNKKDGSFMAPHPVRLGNGSVFLVLTKQVKDQAIYDLYGALIEGDAEKSLLLRH